MELDVYTLEPKTTTRYTIGQFTMLNHGRVKLTPSLQQKFAEYTMPPCSLERAYNNPYNIRFSEAMEGKAPSKKPLLKKKEGVYDDAQILSSLRHAFSSIAKGEGRTILAIADINQIMIPKTMLEKVSELFFDVSVQCPKQMGEYLKVLFGISYQDQIEKTIYLHFVKCAMSCFDTPRVLEDSMLEDGESRTKKHREATCELIARLFTYSFSDDPKHEKPRSFFGKYENLCTRLLDPIFRNIDKGDAHEVKNLVRVWEILLASKKFNLSAYLPKIRSLVENKNQRFKMSTVLLLRDFIKE